jgi:hypothetical protein
MMVRETFKQAGMLFLMTYEELKQYIAEKLPQWKEEMSRLSECKEYPKA